jgi:hypothetical protein
VFLDTPCVLYRCSIWDSGFSSVKLHKKCPPGLGWRILHAMACGASCQHWSQGYMYTPIPVCANTMHNLKRRKVNFQETFYSMMFKAIIHFLKIWYALDIDCEGRIYGSGSCNVSLWWWLLKILLKFITTPKLMMSPVILCTRSAVYPVREDTMWKMPLQGH